MAGFVARRVVAWVLWAAAGAAPAAAANITATQTGNWDATATWNGGPVPTSGDDVTIPASITVTVNPPSPAACDKITINGGLTLSGAATLTAASGWNLVAGGALSANAASLVTVGSAGITVAFTHDNPSNNSFGKLTIIGNGISNPPHIEAQGDIGITSGNNIALAHPLKSSGGSVMLKANSDLQESTGGYISADAVTLNAVGAINMVGTNTARTLTVSGASGEVKWKNSLPPGDGLTVTLPATGLTAVTLTNENGPITASGAITADTVTLDADGAITATGTNTAATLNVTKASVSVTWNNAQAAGFGFTLPANPFTSVTITNASGALTARSAITANTVTLTAGGAITSASGVTHKAQALAVTGAASLEWLNTGALELTLPATPVSGTVSVTNAGDLTLKNDISATGAVTLKATGTGAAIEIAANRTITSSGALILSGKPAVKSGVTAPALTLSGATVTLDGADEIGADVAPFGAFTLTTTGSGLTSRLFSVNATAKALYADTVVINGPGAVELRGTATNALYAASAITINGSLKGNGTRLTLRADALTINSGVVNANNGTLRLYPATLANQAAFGGSDPGGVTYYDAALSNFINIRDIEIGDATNTGGLIVTATGTSGSRFTYPLTLITAGNAEFRGSYYSNSKTLGFTVAGEIRFTTASTLALDTGTAALNFKDNAVTMSVADVTVTAGAISCNGVMSGTNTALTFTNGGVLTLGSGMRADVKQFTQNGTGTVTVNGIDGGSTTPFLKAAGGIEITRAVTFGGTTGATATFKTNNANITFGGALSGNRQKLSLDAGTGNIKVKGATGTSTARFADITVVSAGDAVFGGAVYAGTFTQSAGTGVTYFAAAANLSGNFDVTCAALGTQNLDAVGMITVKNSGVWHSGFTSSAPWSSWSTGSASVAGSSITQGGTSAGPWGAARLTGAIISNSNIKFYGAVEVWTAQMNARNTGKSGVEQGGVIEFFASLAKGWTYDAHVSVTTAAASGSFTNDVTIGAIGAAAAFMGRVDIAHGGLLTLKGDVYAKRLYQTQPGRAVKLTLKEIHTDGTGSAATPSSGEGGIILMGNVKLATTDASHTITLNTSAGNAPIYVGGTTTGNNNLVLNAGNSDQGAITFKGKLGGDDTSFPPADSEAIGSGTGTSILVGPGCVYVNSTSESETLSFGAIRAKGPIKIDTSTAGALSYTALNGNVYVADSTGTGETLFNTRLNASGCYAIKSQGDLRFERGMTYTFGGGASGRLAVETTATTGKIRTGGGTGDTIQCSYGQLDLLTPIGGTVELGMGISLSRGSSSYNAPHDVLYIKTGTLAVKNTTGVLAMTTGSGPYRNVRLITGAAVEYTDENTANYFPQIWAGNGQGRIFIQPWNPGDAMYVAASGASIQPGIRITPALLGGLCGREAFLGSQKQNPADPNGPSHGYADGFGDMTNPGNPANPANRDGTGDIFIGNGVSTPVVCGLASSSGTWGCDLYIQRGAAATGSVTFNFTNIGSLVFRPGFSMFINAEASAIHSSRRMDATTADIKLTVSSGTNIPALFIGAAGVGSGSTDALIVDAPALGSAARAAVDAKTSVYMSNLYVNPHDVDPLEPDIPPTIWKIQANETNGVIAYRSKDAVDIAAASGGMRAAELHVKSEKSILMDKAANSAGRAVLIAGGPGAAGSLPIRFSGDSDNLRFTAENGSTLGTITVSNKGNITLKAAEAADSYTDGLPHAGVVSSHGRVEIHPGAGKMTYVEEGLTDATYPNNAGPVEVRTDGIVSVPAGGAPIWFAGPVLTDPPNKYSVRFAAGSYAVELGGRAGATGNADLLHYFYSLELESGTLTKTSRTPFFAAASRVVLGDAHAADIETQNDYEKNITLRTDGLTKDAGSAIRAGGGDFRIYPITDTALIEYAPSRSLPPPAVFYDSDWSQVSAASFTIGDDSHKGEIVINGVTNTPFALTVRQDTNENIGITIDEYTSLDKALNLHDGLKGVILKPKNAPGNPLINLGTAALALDGLTLESVDTATLTAKGGITIGGDIAVGTSASNNLAMDAGTGDIRIAGTAGESTKRLGKLNIGAAKNVTLEKALWLSGDVDIYHSGTLTTGGDIDVSAGHFYEIPGGAGGTVLGGNVTANSASTLRFGSAAITIRKDLILKENYTGPLTTAAIEFAPNTTLTLEGNLGLDAEKVKFSSGTGSLTFYAAAGAKRTLTFAQQASVAADTGNWLVFKGAGHTITDTGTTAGLIFPNVRIDLDDNTKTVDLNGYGIQQKLPELEILKGRLNTSDRGWTITTGSPAYWNGGFNAQDAAARVTMKPGTALVTQGKFEATNGATLDFDPSSSIVFNGSGTAQDFSATQTVGGIRIEGSAVLNAASDITISGDWTQRPAAAAFTHNNKKLTVRGAREHRFECLSPKPVTETDVFTWYDFEATEAGMTLLFDTWPAKHAIAHTMTLGPAAGDKTTAISRIDNGVRPPDTRPADLDASDPSHRGFWYLSPPDVSAGGTITVNNLDVRYSFLQKERPVEPPLSVLVTPYHKPPDSRYSVNWLRRNIFLYTWTEDSDGNGQIDRLRVQMTGTYQLYGDIARFKPVVEGYAVKDCAYVPGYGPADYDGTNSYMIYINLHESGVPDTGKTPSWDVGENCPLYIEVAGKALPLETYDAMKTLDTAPPRIAYALALANTNEVYVKMSEPVSAAPSGTFALKTIVKSDIIGDGSELLLTLAGPLDAAGLIAATRYGDAAFVGIKDKAGNMLPCDPFFNSVRKEPPYYADRYAADTAHGGAPAFAAVTNGYTPQPFPVAYGGYIAQPNTFTSRTGLTRASDALVLSPLRRDDPGLVFWPVYAKDGSGRSHTIVEKNVIGTAVKFDGTEFLRPSGGTTLASTGGGEDTVIVEAVGSPALAAPPSIVYAFDVADEYRPGGQPAGIWLPDGIPPDDPARNMVPRLLAGAKTGAAAPAKPNYGYKVPERDIDGHHTMEFLFNIGGLYGLRLDGPASGDWYRRLRTFKVGFKELRLQRGGVTVLRNVINPERNEIVALNYSFIRPGRVTIQVFTLDGSLVRILKNESQPAGDYTVSWDGRNGGGRPVARGMYIIRAVAPDLDEIRKVMVIK